MTEGDAYLLLLMIVVVLIGTLYWSFTYISAPDMGWPRAMRFFTVLIPTACLIGMVVLLKLYSASDVRDSYRYMAFYTLMGVIWIQLSLWPASVLGLSLRGDVFDRRNPAAMWAAAGLLIGLTLGFTGGNIGDGPGWWVVVFCAILETAALYLLWLLAEPLAHFIESITVERDSSAGIRFGCLLAASGLILGRAVAGDWVSTGATLSDFYRDAWGLAGIWGFAVIVEMILKPGAQRPPGNAFFMGLMPGILYLTASAAWLMHVGWWS